ncbi:MAG: phosphate-selective porin OprO/OprP [Saprospiraceae bacterium]|jgi:phosphate-selective porin OprO/OprP
MLSASLLVCFCLTLSAQISTKKFGKGIQFQDKDSTFRMKMNVRFQNLISNSWDLEGDDFGSFTNHKSNILVRRSRLKFGGWAYSPKIQYKMEFGLSNRDIGKGIGSEFNKAANVILDAHVTWNFYKGFSIRFGQGKLPGNRERVISSANLQFVDRSRLNSRFNLDRDVGLMMVHKHKIAGDFILIEKVAMSQGEGRNVTGGHFEGYEYTFRLEALPFGSFQSKGDYVSSAIKREPTPKLALGFTYDINNNAVRERGNLGNFIVDNGSYTGKTLNSFHADLMFKYQGLSVMAEYATRETEDGDPIVLSADGITAIGEFFTGSALNVQAGYMFKNNYEIAARVTTVTPDLEIDSDDTRYTLGLSKFVVGHNLKIQTDFTYRSVTTQGDVVDTKDDQFIWRTQFELQF